MKRGLTHIAALCALTVANAAVAAVTAEEAAKLKTELTPLGGARAGNKDGTIPPWEGGYTKSWPGYKAGQPFVDPFAGEKPRLQITAKNMDQYADQLSEGVKALLQRFPTFRLDVYPTHRTAAAPQWVYDNTLKNATRAVSKDDGLSIDGAYGGVPFPIPKTGVEIMRNSMVAWRGEALSYFASNYVVSGGKPILAGASKYYQQYPYYYKDGALDQFNGYVFLVKTQPTAPPFHAGSNQVVHDPLYQKDSQRKVWQYAVGQRRVRRVPNLSYDTPNPGVSGVSLIDEAALFNGSLDRYEWKIVGKKEMLVPYNANGFHTKKLGQVLTPQHLNPDHVRWELHRVWVVEATIASGKRHVIPKRRFYLDEDSWYVMLSEGWDATGRLWHVGHTLPFVLPDLPALIAQTYCNYDLLKDEYEASYLFNEGREYYGVMERKPDAFYAPDTLAAEGIR